MRCCVQVKKPVLWFWLTEPVRPRGRNHLTTWGHNQFNATKYNAAVRQSRLVQPAGPFHVLDMEAVNRECVGWCSADGSHVKELVYWTMWEILTNFLVLPDAAAAWQPKCS